MDNAQAEQIRQALVRLGAIPAGGITDHGLQTAIGAAAVAAARGEAGGGGGAGGLANRIKLTLPILPDEVLTGIWESHKAGMSTYFHLQDLMGVDADLQQKKKFLLYHSLGSKGRVKASHLPPTDQPMSDDPANPQTYEQYQDLVSNVFQPRAESDMSKVDFRRAKQSEVEPFNSFYSRKLQLFKSGWPALVAAGEYDYFVENFIDSTYRKEVKLDLLKGRPYASPDELLTRGMDVVAVYRTILPTGHTPTRVEMGGLYSSHNVASTAMGGARPNMGGGVASGGVVPMDTSALDNEYFYEEDGEYGEDVENMMSSLNAMTMETEDERAFWEDPYTQSCNAATYGGAAGGGDATMVCWSCAQTGHRKADCWLRRSNQQAAVSTLQQVKWARGRGGGRGLFTGSSNRGRGRSSRGWQNNNNSFSRGRANYPIPSRPGRWMSRGGRGGQRVAALEGFEYAPPGEDLLAAVGSPQAEEDAVKTDQDF